MLNSRVLYAFISLKLNKKYISDFLYLKDQYIPQKKIVSNSYFMTYLKFIKIYKVSSEKKIIIGN